MSGLTSVLSAQSQHEANGEDLGPGSLPLLYEDAKEVGWVGQQQVLQRLEGGADVQEATVLLAAQEALREEGVAQVAQHVAFGRRGRGRLARVARWGQCAAGGEKAASDVGGGQNEHKKNALEENTHIHLEKKKKTHLKLFRHLDTEGQLLLKS